MNNAVERGAAVGCLGLDHLAGLIGVASLRLRLLGSPDLVHGEQKAAFPTQKAVALLAYLAVEQGPHAREAVADLLWPTADAEDARSSARTAIWHIRRALGDAAAATLLTTRDTLELAPSAPLDIDVHLLSEARHRIRVPGDTGYPSGVVPGGPRAEVQQAISLYRGPFLGELSVPDAPEFDAWLSAQRAHWLGVVGELLDWLSTVQLEADDLGAALVTLDRWTLLDPGEEVAWQRMIELHLAQGNRVRARWAWDAYQRALQDLGVESSPQLAALGSQVEASFPPERPSGYPLGLAAEPAPSGERDLVQVPFVGRARELMQLRRAFERARAGEPQAVVLIGHAGIGKTRLAEVFLAWTVSQGADVLRSRGFETTADLPYASLVESLRGQLERENAPDDLLDDPWLAELSQLLPELRVRYPDLSSPTLDPALGRHQLFEAVSRLLKAFAERRPLVVFRDDWHWSDTDSRDLMRYSLRRWAEGRDRVLMILAVSAERLGTDRILAQWMGGMERDVPTTRVSLERLAPEDIALWMAALAGTEGEGSFTDAAAARLGDWLVERAGRRPSQIIAALRSLIEQQVLSFRQREDGGWTLDLTSVPQLAAQLPEYPVDVVSDNVASPPSRHHDWGDAPDSRQLHGRREQLDQLERWVVTERCREVAVLGIGGIGKTALAVRLAHDVAPHFEFVFWRSLKNALPFDEWLSDAARAMSEQQQVTLPENQEARVLLLLDLLRAHRCLLVLDNLETVLEPGQREATYREGYAAYGLLLQRLGEVEHQSCLLLTSREKPLEVAHLEGKELPVRTLQLTGLGTREGRALLERERLDGVDEDWQALVERYAGNPLGLQVVAETIGHIFAGDIAAFLREGEAVYGDIRRVLDAQVDRLSDLEKTLLYWLAVDREPVGFVELVSDLEPPAPRGEVLEAIEGLRHRSLLERGKQGGAFTLQPVVLEYVTNRLVSAAAQEIRDGDLGLLRTHVLSKAQSKSFVRQSQERLIVLPILERLVPVYGSNERVERRLLDLLEELRSQDRWDYAPGNLIKLLQLSRGNLRGLDFSHLYIRQVYLQEVDAQDATLAGSHLSECVLADSFDVSQAVTFSSDGRYLAAGTFSGEVCVWRIADCTRIVSLPGHQGAVCGIDWTSDGHILATGGHDAAVKLWEVSQTVTHGVSGVRFLATLEGHTGFVWCVSFSGDSQLIASGSLDGTVKLWETSTGRLLHTLQGHAGAVWGVALSGDGHILASASQDGTVKLWKTGSGSLLSTLEGHGSEVRDVVLTADGRMAASAGVDGIIRLWEITTGHLVTALQGHTDTVLRLAMSADGRLLMSGGQDGTVRLWDLPGGVSLAALEAHAGPVYDLAISPDVRRISSVSQDGTLKLWEVPTGKLVTTLQGYARGAWGVAWDASAALLASGTQDGTVNLWDVFRQGTSATLRATLRGHSRIVHGAALSEDGVLLATGGQDGAIRLWQVADSMCVRTMQAHVPSVYGLAFSPDGQLLMSSGHDGLIKLWEVSSGDLLATIQAHTDLIFDIALSGDGHFLASASQDGTVKLWEIPSGRLLATMQDDGDLFWGVALSRDGKLIASGGQSGRVSLWEVTQGGTGCKLVATLGEHKGAVWGGVDFSPDSRLLVSGGLDSAVLLWDVAARRLIARLTGHDGPVNDVAMSPDGSLIASSGQDGTVLLWDTESGARRAILRPGRRYERMDITGLTGVSDVQKMVLKTLGAVERAP